jgi:hypothetical protein
MVMMWIKCFDFGLRGDATPGREKGGDGASWDDINFTGLKNKKNSRSRFSCYKWTVKI